MKLVIDPALVGRFEITRLLPNANRYRTHRSSAGFEVLFFAGHWLRA